MGDGIEAAVSCYLFDWRRQRLRETGVAFGNEGSPRRGKWMSKMEIAVRAALSRPTAGETADAMFEMIAGALAGGQDVQISGQATFGTRDRRVGRGHDPRTLSWRR